VGGLIPETVGGGLTGTLLPPFSATKRKRPHCLKLLRRTLAGSSRSSPFPAVRVHFTRTTARPDAAGGSQTAGWGGGVGVDPPHLQKIKRGVRGATCLWGGSPHPPCLTPAGKQAPRRKSHANPQEIFGRRGGGHPPSLPSCGWGGHPDTPHLQKIKRGEGGGWYGGRYQRDPYWTTAAG